MNQRTKIASAVIALGALTLCASVWAKEEAAKTVPDTPAGEVRNEVQLPAVSESKWELDTAETRGVQSGMYVEPLLKVHPSRREKALALIEAKQSGTYGGKEATSEFEVPRASPEMEGVPRVVGQSGEPKVVEPVPLKVELPKALNIIPGQPVSVPTTLQGAIEAKERQDEGIAAPVLIMKPIDASTEAPVRSSLTEMAPSISGIKPPEPERADAQVVAERSQSDATDDEASVVLFEVVNPSTWGPAYNAYLSPHISPKLAAGLAALFFVIAFVLGRAVAQGGKER